jgi:GNAT superfamily N-acetyltransferase
MTAIRALDRSRQEEIELVAARMRDTLVEVLGEARGGGMYTHEWLVERVRWHLDPARSTGEVLVADPEHGGPIIGHAIVRLDDDGEGRPIGLFSTIFVASQARRTGIASTLIQHGEAWMRSHGMATSVTYTDKDNGKLQALFRRAGYELEPMPRDFVKLAKILR